MNVSQRHIVRTAFVLTGLALLSFGVYAENFVVTSIIEPPSAGSGETVTLKVNFTLADGVHVYKDKLSFSWEELQGVSIGEMSLPPATAIPDPLDETGQTLTEVYDKGVTVSVPLTVSATAGGTATIRGVVTYQGCTDTLCFPPMKEQLSFVIPVAETTVAAAPEEPSPAPPAPSRPSQKPPDQGFLLRILMAFGVGVLISLTPCVYPMIPVTAAVVAGSQKGGGGSVANALARSVAYVLGLAIVYATLGVLSASLGSVFSQWLKTAWVLVPVAGIFVLLALSMFEVITIQMPGFITRRVRGRSSGGTIGGVFVLGLVAGIVATPCIAAPLAGMLTFIATTGNRLLGFGMLFALAWGMGLILITVGTVSSSALPKAGPWTVWIKKLFGFIMLWAAAYFLQPVIGVAVYRLVSAIVIMVAALFLGGLDTLWRTGSLADRLKHTVGILALVLAVLFMVNSVGALLGVRFGKSPDVRLVEGEPFQLADSATLEKALASGRPTVVEFYAEWCAQCKKLERKTLLAAPVTDALLGLNTLRIDYDRNPALQLKYDVIGVPTVLFFDMHGREVPDLRTSGFVGPIEMLAAVDKIRTTTHARR